MMKLFVITTLLVSMLAAASISPLHAQSSRKGRPCTVNLVEGDPVKGYFVRADAKGVTIEAEGTRKTIKLENVTSIVFTIPMRLRMQPDPAASGTLRESPLPQS